ARSALARSRGFAEQSVRQSPDDAARHALLGQILAGLGEKEAAIEEGKKAVQLLPESEDAFDGPIMSLQLAQIYALIGDKDQALQLIERSLNTPNGITVQSLKLDPIWDGLRNDPRFKTLID